MVAPWLTAGGHHQQHLQRGFQCVTWARSRRLRAQLWGCVALYTWGGQVLTCWPEGSWVCVAQVAPRPTVCEHHQQHLQCGFQCATRARSRRMWGCVALYMWARCQQQIRSGQRLGCAMSQFQPKSGVDIMYVHLCTPAHTWA